MKTLKIFSFILFFGLLSIPLFGQERPQHTGTAQFNGPYGIAVGSDGSLCFTDLYSYAIHEITFE